MSEIQDDGPVAENARLDGAGQSILSKDRYPWPEQMRATTAAAYCDEVSETAFLRAVQAGLYPKPEHVRGKGYRWLKSKLKTAIEQIHGAAAENAGGGASLRDLV